MLSLLWSTGSRRCQYGSCIRKGPTYADMAMFGQQGVHKLWREQVIPSINCSLGVRHSASHQANDQGDFVMTDLGVTSQSLLSSHSFPFARRSTSLLRRDIIDIVICSILSLTYSLRISFADAVTWS